MNASGRHRLISDLTARDRPGSARHATALLRMLEGIAARVPAMDLSDSRDHALRSLGYPITAPVLEPRTSRLARRDAGWSNPSGPSRHGPTAEGHRDRRDRRHGRSVRRSRREPQGRFGDADGHVGNGRHRGGARVRARRSPPRTRSSTRTPAAEPARILRPRSARVVVHPSSDPAAPDGWPSHGDCSRPRRRRPDRSLGSARVTNWRLRSGCAAGATRSWAPR